MVRREERMEKVKPVKMMWGESWVESEVVRSGKLRRVAPKMEMMPRRKANWVAGSFCSPEKTPPERVAPDLEIPGKMAMA